MNQVETWYRTQEGKLVFHAVPSVGRDRAYPYRPLTRQGGGGFPVNAPAQRHEDTIWAAFSTAAER